MRYAAGRTAWAPRQIAGNIEFQYTCARKWQQVLGLELRRSSRPFPGRSDGSWPGDARRVGLRRRCANRVAVGALRSGTRAGIRIPATRGNRSGPDPGGPNNRAARGSAHGNQTTQDAPGDQLESETPGPERAARIVDALRPGSGSSGRERFVQDL
jgi:hypothetical protein